MFISKEKVKEAVLNLRGSANHLLKIWMVLKTMGLSNQSSVIIDTGNSTQYLKRLFDYGASDGSFYVPFSHTLRFAFMKSDASRSIIQTTLQRWATSNSVVTCDPSAFINISNAENNKLIVKTSRQYPLGLGYGKNGFALDDEQRVNIPAEYFAIWLFAREDIGKKTINDLVDDMVTLLHLSIAEYKTIFVNRNVKLEYSPKAITNDELYNICKHAFDQAPIVEEKKEPIDAYIRRVKNMVTISESPTWVQTAPETQLSNLLKDNEAAILLFGPPRTGKTRAIDNVVGRANKNRISIQLHEGWGYENLVLGMFPGKEPGAFEWKEGALLSAIKSGKHYIVLEEINRTNVSQALGEMFSLIESAYRGEKNAITLPNGESVFIPNDTVIFMTMNTIDTSTEDIDDALIGRMASVYFPPRVEDLDSMLVNNKINDKTAEKIKEVFNSIQKYYPLGHGYFAEYREERNFKIYYLSRIRPVLTNHFETYKPEVILQIDNVVDSLF